MFSRCWIDPQMVLYLAVFNTLSKQTPPDPLCWCCYGRRALITLSWNVLVVAEWTPAVSVWEEVLNSRLSIQVVTNRASFRADDDHAVWKLYRLLNGLRHKNYVNFQVKKKRKEKPDSTFKKQNGDMRSSSERQQHYDSVSVFTCSMVCPAGRDM